MAFREKGIGRPSGEVKTTVQLIDQTRQFALKIKQDIGKRKQTSGGKVLDILKTTHYIRKMLLKANARAAPASPAQRDGRSEHAKHLVVIVAERAGHVAEQNVARWYSRA